MQAPSSLLPLLPFFLFFLFFLLPSSFFLSFPSFSSLLPLLPSSFLLLPSSSSYGDRSTVDSEHQIVHKLRLCGGVGVKARETETGTETEKACVRVCVRERVRGRVEKETGDIGTVRCEEAVASGRTDRGEDRDSHTRIQSHSHSHTGYGCRHTGTQGTQQI